MAPRQGYEGRRRPARGSRAKSAPKNETLTSPHEISQSRTPQSPSTATVEDTPTFPPASPVRPVTRAQAKKLLAEAKRPQERPRRNSPSATVPATATGKSRIRKDRLANCYPDVHSKTQERQYVPGFKLSKGNLKKLQKQLLSASDDMASVRPTTRGNRGGKRGGNRGGGRGGHRRGKGTAASTTDTSTETAEPQDSTTPATTSTARAHYRFKILRSVNIDFSVHSLPQDIQSQLEVVFNRKITTEMANWILRCTKLMSNDISHMTQDNFPQDDFIEPLIHVLDLYKEDVAILGVARKFDFHSSLKPQLSQPGQDSGVKTPRPDCIVGFRKVAIDDILSKGKGKLAPMRELEAQNILCADPTSNGAGVLFPALVIEGQAYSTGASMFKAENEAAVAASCIINLLRLFTDVHDRYAPDSPRAKMAPFVFSITTEGPQLQLSVHYPRVNDGCTLYQSTVVGYWHAGVSGHVEQFLSKLAQLMDWMKNEFLTGIVDQLVVVAENV
ncbi:hypothetical protein AYL99_09853 [Fonsecaea erecta]|uniref:DUF7924 domain-containing protein n=1 Tax=Fonsecaea erecta TaxID=1367422 RepID=A0A178Z881_9EURO|nr:hypothetical protein AYL99_09853 [Fonsecaea erecta]OAP55701.1 hypothetical protein AYL99_09853 [Fonsecaea erecta]